MSHAEDQLDPAWVSWLGTTMGRLLGDENAGRTLAGDRGANLFERGFDSLRTFALSDELFALGIDIDFAQIVQEGTTGFLLDEIARSGVAAP